MAERTDAPDQELPLIDSPHIDVEASPEACWAALTSGIGEPLAGPGARALAAVLGCEDRETRGSRETEGSALIGFHVARSQRPHCWQLRGAHRFADYALTFRIEGIGEGRSRVEAESRARFPGWHGRLYRTVVVRSHGHRLAVRHLLYSVKARAEAAPVATASGSPPPLPPPPPPPLGRGSS